MTDRIDSIFDEAAILAQAQLLLDKITLKLKSFPALRVNLDGSESIQQFSRATKALSDEQRALIATTNDLKVKNLELKNARQEVALQMQKEQQVLIATARVEKEAAAASKLAAAEQVTLGRERILLLRAQQAEVDKLAAAENQRLTAGSAGINGVSTNNQRAQVVRDAAPIVQVPTLTNDQQKISFIQSYQGETKQLTAANELLRQSYLKGEISQAQFNSGIAISTEKIIANNIAVKALNRELALSAAVSSQERNSLGRAQALVLEYTNAKKGLNLATAEGTLLNNNYNKAIDNTNKFILKNADAVTAQSKNVGNYAGSVGGFFQKAYSGLRTLANILPGIGISGLVLFAIEPIIKWITAIKEATGNAKLLQDTLNEGAKGAASDVALLDIEKQKLNDLNKPASERILIAKEYNKTAAEGNKINLEEINNLTLINEQIGKQIGLIEKQSLAKAAQATIATFAEKAIQAEFKLQEALNQTGLTEDKVQKSLQGRLNKQDELAKKQNQSLDGFNKNGIIDKNLQKGVEQVEFVDKKLEFLLIKKKSAAAELDRVIRLLLPDLSDSGIITPDKKTKPKKDGSLQQLKDELNTQFEINKLAQERLIKLFEGEVKDEKLTLEARLSALDKFVKASQALIENQAAQEEKLARQKSAREIQKLNEEKKGKSGTQVARIDNNIAITEANLQQEILLIQEQAADKSIALTLNAANQRHDILEKQLKADEIAYKQMVDFLKKLDDDEFDRFSIQLKKKDKARLEDLEREKQINQKRYELAKATEDLLVSIFDGGFQNKSNVIAEQQRLLDETTQRQINNINALGLTEVERTRQTAIVQKQSAFQKQQLEEKQRRLDYDKAKFDRFIAIADVVANTAKAVTADLVKNKALIPFDIAIGALQLANILARPLPRFAKGTENAPKGAALVGEIGAELIMPKSGPAFLSPNTPSLIDLAGGEKIFTADRTKDILNAINLQHLIGLKGNKITDEQINDHLTRQMLSELKDLNRKSRVMIQNNVAIETTAWYQNNIRN